MLLLLLLPTRKEWISIYIHAIPPIEPHQFDWYYIYFHHSSSIDLRRPVMCRIVVAQNKVQRTFMILFPIGPFLGEKINCFQIE